MNRLQEEEEDGTEIKVEEVEVEKSRVSPSYMNYDYWSVFV